MRECLQTMKIKVYEQSQVLFNQYELPKHQFYVLLGTVNMYQNIIQDTKKVIKSNLNLVTDDCLR